MRATRTLCKRSLPICVLPAEKLQTIPTLYQCDLNIFLFRFSWKWRRRSPSKVRRERMKKQRKHYAPEEKIAILRRHLLEKEPISKLCDELGLQPTVFYR